MSADNGIYILKTIGPEYRVRHLQAVDNICWDQNNKCESSDFDVMIVNAREMWYGSEVFLDEDTAWKYARKLQKEVGYTEYGVSVIHVDRSFAVNNCVVEVCNPVKGFSSFKEAYDYLMLEDEDCLDKSWLSFNLSSGESITLEKIEIDGKFYLTVENTN